VWLLKDTSPDVKNSLLWCCGQCGVNSLVSLTRVNKHIAGVNVYIQIDSQIVILWKGVKDRCAKTVCNCCIKRKIQKKNTTKNGLNIYI
jgi:hypothetical protein